jgi:hypothetical protein
MWTCSLFLGKVTAQALDFAGQHEKHWVNYLPALHFSEQYFTFSQSRAHFLRHSKARLQRWQILGAKPFFVLAIMS